jgi:uncharacterized protein YdcH (DUF465 family)
MKWILYTLIMVVSLAVFHSRKFRMDDNAMLASKSLASLNIPSSYMSAQAQKTPTQTIQPPKSLAAPEYNGPEVDQVTQGLMDDMNFIHLKWQTFRDAVYRDQLGLSNAELMRIQKLRSFYRDKFDDLTPYLESGSDQQKSEAMTEMSKQSAAFSDDIARILGREKFAALKEWKDYFNREIHNQVRTGIEVNTSW